MSKGTKFGRRKIGINKDFKFVYTDWKQNNITAVEAMRRLGMKSNTFYRRVKEYELSRSICNSESDGNILHKKEK